MIYLLSICIGVFDAQPTASERQRENLSSRLRREFGLALPDDEEARPPTDHAGTHTYRYIKTSTLVIRVTETDVLLIHKIDTKSPPANQSLLVDTEYEIYV